jgi:hypothetical protein
VKGSYIVSKQEFDDVLNRHWPASVPRPPLRPVLAMRTYGLLRALLSRSKVVPAPAELSSAQMRLVSDIDASIQQRHLPVLVAFVPSKEAMLQSPAAGQKEYLAVQSFALALHARVLDGRLAFANIDRRALRNYFFEYDGHWNQKGSDQFAEWMSRELSAANVSRRAH